MGMFGPNKQLMKLATLAADMRKDLTNLEKQLEALQEEGSKKQEAMAFEIEQLKQKLDKMTSILQAHVKAVLPRLEAEEKMTAEFEDRISKLEQGDVDPRKRKVRGGVDLTDIVEEHDVKLEELLNIVQNEILPKFSPVEKEVSAMRSEVNSLTTTVSSMESRIQECEGAATAARSVANEFGDLKSLLLKKVEDVCEDTLNLRYDYDLMLHTNTRFVNWKIEAARTKITEMFMRTSSLWSPPFTMATFPVMYLQLRVQAGDSPGSQSAARQVQNLGRHLPTNGGLVVTVWTQPGVEAVFRISVGAVTKKFRAIFERDEANPDQEVVGCTVTNFCALDPAWNRLNDTMLVGLEIMEADLTGTVELAVNQPKVLTDYPALNDHKTAEMQFKRRIISDTQMLEQVDRKLQNLKQRWVRKVEWQIRQILPLLEKSAANDVIESPPFSAAGISELKFVFYPKGIEGGLNPGWCGLYLRCSEENVFVKFQLSVGKQAKTFEHFFATRGEVYGKTKFCYLESQIENRQDPELSVLNVSVEVLEVSHRKRDTENVLLFHREDTYAKEEYRVLTLPPRG
mmetsp:Transcript_18497/g.46167  ORF Transcript_18497/g.46167 Transcript_18497/m.46167 type:complete len:570 (+) Transcript_18497:437-2146(+)